MIPAHMTSVTRNCVSWICAIALGMVGVLYQGGLVLCTNADGSVRIEWACDGGDEGCSETPSGETAGSQPCRDSTLESDGAMKAGSRPKAAAARSVELPAVGRSADPGERRASLGAGPAVVVGPNSVLSALRTTIMLI
jgi:hypothetical protein